jgi:hypothetical protein
MSDMRTLLESMNKFAGQEVGQKPGDQVRGTEKAKPSKKGHPFKGRLVGGESADGVSEDIESELREEYSKYIAEYGAGRGASAMGGGADEEVSPRDAATQRMQQNAGKDQAKGQVAGLVAQVQGARSQLADLNKQFPQGANPVEKAMSLQQASAQKVGLARQIEDLSSQIAAMRSQTQ